METITKKIPTLLEWFTGTKVLLNLGFTEEEIIKAITDSGNDMMSLTDSKGFKQIPQWVKTYQIMKESGHRYYYEEYDRSGQYKRTVTAIGMELRVIAQYQGLKHGGILFALFSNKWDWFKSFTKDETIEKKIFLSDLPISKIPKEYADTPLKELRMQYIIEKELQTNSLWEIYECREANPEIYLKTENGSLYVPIKALIDADFSLIQERMHNYFGSYHRTDLSGYALNHRGRTEAEYLLDQEKQKNEALLALKSKEALALKQFLTNKS